MEDVYLNSTVYQQPSAQNYSVEEMRYEAWKSSTIKNLPFCLSSNSRNALIYPMYLNHLQWKLSQPFNFFSSIENNSFLSIKNILGNPHFTEFSCEELRFYTRFINPPKTYLSSPLTVWRGPKTGTSSVPLIELTWS